MGVAEYRDDGIRDIASAVDDRKRDNTAAVSPSRDGNVPNRDDLMFVAMAASLRCGKRGAFCPGRSPPSAPSAVRVLVVGIVVGLTTLDSTAFAAGHINTVQSGLVVVAVADGFSSVRRCDRRLVRRQRRRGD